MNIETWLIVGIIFLILAIIVLVAAILPFIRQLKKTVFRLEEAVSSINSMIENEVRPILLRGGSIAEKIDGLTPNIKTGTGKIGKLTSRLVIENINRLVMKEASKWALKKGWGLMTARKSKKKGKK